MRTAIGLLAVALFLGTGFTLAAPVPLPKPRPIISADTAKRVVKVRELPYDVWSIVWGPRSGQVSFLSWQKSIVVLDGNWFQPIRTIGEGESFVDFAYDPKGEMVALSPKGNTVEIRKFQNPVKLPLNTGNRQPFSALSPGGKVLATGGYGTKVKL